MALTFPKVFIPAGSAYNIIGSKISEVSVTTSWPQVTGVVLGNMGGRELMANQEPLPIRRNVILAQVCQPVHVFDDDLERS